MRVERFVAPLPQFVSMYLLFCFLANWMSIFSPMAIRSGSFKPANPRGLALLFQLVLTFVFPFVLAPALLPFGIEYRAGRIRWISRRAVLPDHLTG